MSCDKLAGSSFSCPVRSPSAPVAGTAVGISSIRHWHRDPFLDLDQRSLRAGCRGFTGPVPQPLWMSALSMAGEYVRVESLCQDATLGSARWIWPSHRELVRVFDTRVGRRAVDGHDGQVIAASVRQPELFEVIFDRHYRAVVRFAVGRVGSTEGPDVAAETFLRAFSRRARFDPSHETALPWLFGIAVNVGRERLRKVARGRKAFDRMTPPLEVQSPFEVEAVERSDAEARSQQLSAALAELTDDEYHVLMLAAIGDLSYQEISDTLDIPIGTVRSRLSRSRRRMRELVDSVRPTPTGNEPAPRARLH